MGCRLKEKRKIDMAALLKRVRYNLDMTQEELAGLTGLHRPNIARIESGRHYPTSKTLERLVGAYKRSIGGGSTQVSKLLSDLRSLNEKNL